MAAYRAYGDANGVKLAKVELTARKSGAKKTETTKTIRKPSGLGLTDSKHIVDDCLDGEARIMKARTVEAADLLAQELAAINFVAQVRYTAR